MNLSLIFGSFVMVGGAVFALTGSLRQALIAGAVSAVSALIVIRVATSRWRAAVRLVTSAREPDDVRDALLKLEREHATNAQELQLLRSVLEALPEGLCVTSPEGTVLMHNRRLADVLETRSPEVKGWAAREVMSDVQVLAAVDRAGRSEGPLSISVVAEHLRVTIATLAGKGSVALFVPR